MRATPRLGRFSGSIPLAHMPLQLSHENTISRMQNAIIQSLHRLNGNVERWPLSVAGREGASEGELSIEVGVANGMVFDYMNAQTVRSLYGFLGSGKTFPILDFLVVATYHYHRAGKKVALKFDHFLFRFTFHEGRVEVLLSHIKGPQRMPMDGVLNRVLRGIREEAERQRLKAIIVDQSRTR